MQFRPRGGLRLLSRAHDHIHAGQLVLVQAERLADDPPELVTLDSAARRAYRNGQAESRPTFVVPRCRHTKKSITEPPAPRVGCIKIRFSAQAFLRGECEPLWSRAVAGQAILSSVDGDLGVSGEYYARRKVACGSNRGDHTLRDELATALGAATSQYGAAILGSHTCTEPVRARTPHFARLIGALHRMGSADGPWGFKKRAARLSR